MNTVLLLALILSLALAVAELVLTHGKNLLAWSVILLAVVLIVTTIR